MNSYRQPFPSDYHKFVHSLIHGTIKSSSPIFCTIGHVTIFFSPSWSDYISDYKTATTTDIYT